MFTLRDRTGAVEALAPFEDLGAELRSPTNYHSPAFELIAADVAAGRRLAETVAGEAPRRLSLAFLPASSGTRDLTWEAARRVGRDPFERVLERCPFVEPAGDWDRYLSTRRGHLVRELRRRRRGLERRGTLELEVVGDGAREDASGPHLDRLLEEVFRVEASGWKGELGSAMAASPDTRRFYRRLTTWLHDRGSLRLALLRLDGHAIAVDIAVEDGGVHSLLKTGFDVAFRTSAPGMLLREAMLRRAFERGLRRYDFLGHADAWKREWTDLAEPQLLLQVFAPTVAGRLDAAAQRHARPAVRQALALRRQVTSRLTSAARS